MLLQALKGFEAACDRWESARAGLDEAESFVPLAECLWWAVSIDERCDTLEGASYRKRRDADPDGRLLPGVQWARNRTGHDQAMVLRYHPGAELGRLVLDVSALDTSSQLIWRSATDLPPGRGHRQRDVYVKHLEGKPVSGTVAALRRWLHGPARNSPALTFPMPT